MSSRTFLSVVVRAILLSRKTQARKRICTTHFTEFQIVMYREPVGNLERFLIHSFSMNYFKVDERAKLLTLYHTPTTISTSRHLFAHMSLNASSPIIIENCVAGYRSISQRTKSIVPNYWYLDQQKIPEC